MDGNMDTDKFLAIRYKHLSKDLLEQMDQGIDSFIQKNGGDVEMHVRWNRGVFKWIDWVERVFRRSK